MSIVRFQRAILCTDCEVISEGKGQCELCSSRAVLSVSRVLDRAECEGQGRDNMNTRRYPRYEADIPLVATLIDDREVCTVRGHGRVISEGGVGAAMGYAIPIGDVVSLELHLANLTEALHVRAVCRNCRAERCGFEFVALSGHEQELIARYCRMQARWSALKSLVCGKGAGRPR